MYHLIQECFRAGLEQADFDLHLYSSIHVGLSGSGVVPTLLVTHLIMSGA